MTENFLLTVISAVLCENFVFERLLGLDTAADPESGAGKSFIRVLLTSIFMIPASIFAFHADRLLEGWNAGYLKGLVFALLLALLEIGADTLLNRIRPGTAVGKIRIFLNSAVFAVILSSVGCADAEAAMQAGIICGTGLLLGSLLILAIRERLDTADLPESFRGIPGLVIAGGLCAMILTGFSGLTF